MKIALVVSVVILVGLVILEILLRVIAGFGNPLIYIRDPEIGYLLAPSQKTQRFGNLIEINPYSMRSPAVTVKPPASTRRILLLGDSIVNGGWWTDQSKILSEQIRQQLTSETVRAEVLNVSANSWGPPNQLAYLERYGTFNSEIIVLVINTDDLFSKVPNPFIVGYSRNYPAKKPPFALWELFDRYWGSDQPIPDPPDSPESLKSVQDPVGYNLDKIQKIQEIVVATEAEFLLAMTPLLREVGEPGPRDYEGVARQRLTTFAQEQNISYIDFLPLFNQIPDPETFYRDHIHLSLLGNQFVSQTLSQQL